jgi:hypothetical protein
MSDRAEYVAGLRILADLLEQHDDLSLPYPGTGTPLAFMVVTGRQAERHSRVHAIAELLAVPMEFNDPARGGYDRTYLALSGSLAGLKVSVSTHRAEFPEDRRDALLSDADAAAAAS